MSEQLIVSFIAAIFITYYTQKQIAFIINHYDSTLQKSRNPHLIIIWFMMYILLIKTASLYSSKTSFFIVYAMLITLVIIGRVDYKTMYILDCNHLVLLCLILCYRHQMHHSFSLFLPFFLLIFFGAYTKYRKEVIGGGDIKLCLLMSLLFEPKSYWIAILFAISSAMIHFVILIYKKEFSYTVPIPFGPHLAGAIIIVLLFEQELLSLI